LLIDNAIDQPTFNDRKQKLLLERQASSKSRDARIAPLRSPSSLQSSNAVIASFYAMNC
jgi:hypothetical protein